MCRLHLQELRALTRTKRRLQQWQREKQPRHEWRAAAYIRKHASNPQMRALLQGEPARAWLTSFAFEPVNAATVCCGIQQVRSLIEHQLIHGDRRKSGGRGQPTRAAMYEHSEVGSDKQPV